MTKNETGEALRLVFSAYPTHRARMKPDDMRAMAEIWSMALADVPLEMVKAAIARIVCTSQWMPTIAEVRAQIGVLHHGLRRSGVDAWGDIKALRTYRERDAMAQVDPVVLHVCKAFDWIVWRTLWRGGEDVEQWHVETGENESADRARFVELYDKTTADDRHVAQLTPGGKIPERISSTEPKSLGDIVKGMLPGSST